MPLEMKPITTTEALDALIDESHQQPVILYKHSYRCGIAAYALQRVEQALADLSPEQARAYMIDVVASRPVSQEAAQRLNVMHQSPQYILLRNGQAVFNTSHSRITPEVIKDTVEKQQAAER